MKNLGERNNYCLRESYWTTYTRKSPNLNMTSLSKCKGNILECLLTVCIPLTTDVTLRTIRISQRL